MTITTNSNPEGLPSRIPLPGGYYLERNIHEGWTIKSGRTDLLAYGYLSPNTGKRFAVAMNAHTDALGAALESLIEHSEGLAKQVSGLGYSTTLYDVVIEARSALEAWRSGR